jgi:hypothetical protein
MSVTRGSGLVLVLSVLILFSGVFVSAFSFGDFFGGITGRVAGSSSSYTTFNKVLYSNDNGILTNRTEFVLDKPMNITYLKVVWAQASASTTSSCDNGYVFGVKSNGQIVRLAYDSSLSVPSITSSYTSSSGNVMYSKIIINSSCLEGLKLFALNISGRYNDNTDFVSCVGDAYIQCNSKALLAKRCVSGRYVDIVPTPTCYENDCFSRCNVTSPSMVSPVIQTAPSACYYRGGCSQNISLVSQGSIDGYDIIWTYFYEGYPEGVEICSCDGNMSKRGNPTRVSGSNTIVPFLNDSNREMIKNISYSIFSYKGANRSAPVSRIIQNIDYRCSSECNFLGENMTIDDSDPTNYKTCVRNESSNYCFKWSAPMSCPVSSVFDNEGLKCSGVLGTNDCYDSRPGKEDMYFCNTSAKSLTNAEAERSKSCGIPGVGCYKCDGGYKYDSQQGFCVSNSCFNQGGGVRASECNIAKGICNNSVGFTNAIVNDSLDCCNPDFKCFICGDGYHARNNSCVSNECSGSKPYGSNFTLGVNNTNVSSVNMVWNYVVGPVGACQWNCSRDYRINISDNLSCMYGRVMCSDTSVNGICTNVSLSGGVNYSVSADCASGSCFVCDSSLRYFSNGSACVLNNSCISGMTWNGLTCVSPIASCTGCVLGTKCIGSSDVTKIMRVNVNIGGSNTKAYCDPSSKMFVPLVVDNQTCSYNAQCASNLCGADLRCLNIAKEVRDASGMMKKVYCWFSTGFSLNSTAYNACLAAP